MRHHIISRCAFVTALALYTLPAMGAPPGPPSLVAPAHNTTISSAPARFSWSASTNADSYRFCHADPAGNCYQAEAGSQTPEQATVKVVRATYIDISAAELSNLRNAGKTQRNWTVRACNSEGCSNYGEIRTIRIASAPPPPNLSAPAHRASYTTAPIDFSWSAVSGAAAFSFCLAAPGANCAARSGSVSIKSVAGNSLRVIREDPLIQPFLGKGATNWTVASCDAIGCGSYQSAYREIRFEVPPPPNLVSPAAGAVVASAPARFEWSLVQSYGASGYVLCIADPGDNCKTGAGAPWLSQPTIGVAYRDLSSSELALFAGKAQNWTVASCNGLGCGNFQGSVRSATFGGLPTVPILTAPAAGAVISSWPTTATANLFRWTGDATATHRMRLGPGGKVSLDNTRTLAPGSYSCTPDPNYPYSGGQTLWSVQSCNAFGCVTSAERAITLPILSVRASNKKSGKKKGSSTSMPHCL